MATSRSVSLSTALTGLFSVLLLFLAVIIGQDFVRDVRTRSSAALGKESVRTATGVFQAMQAIRSERGSTLRLLAQPLGAEPETLAKMPEGRALSANVVDMVKKVCEITTCAPGLGETDVKAAMDKLNALRSDVDAALKQEREKRREGLAQEWTAVVLTTVELLSRTSSGLLEPLRLSDPNYADLFVLKDAALAAREAYSGVRISLDAIMASKNAAPDVVQRLVVARARLEGAWAPYRAAAKRDTTPEAIKRAAASVESSYITEYVKAIDATVAAIAAKNEPPMAVPQLNGVADRAMFDLDAAANTALAAVNTRAEEIQSAAEIGLIIKAIELLATVGLGIGGLLVVRLRVARPLHRITQDMLRVARGDLTGEVTYLGRRDEIGDLAGALETFKENASERERLETAQAADRAVRDRRAAAVDGLLRTFDALAAKTLGAVAAASTELGRTAESMADMAQRTNQEAGASAAAAEQTSANVQTVASATEEMASSIKEIGRQVGNSNEIASRAVAQAGQTTSTVRSLVETVGRIDEVVKLIQDIASQTNLLALNATIEAARAGEAGKGFAVVAGEVKNLAGQTAKATGDIGAQIEAVRAATKDTVTAIEDIARTITSINEISSAIAAAIEEQNATTDEIARNVQEAARGTQEVSHNIALVSHSATETGDAAAQVLAASEDLAREAEGLRHNVEDFLDGIRKA
jgi:methyl-accepting chemotaxis protein